MWVESSTKLDGALSSTLFVVEYSVFLNRVRMMFCNVRLRDNSVFLKRVLNNKDLSEVQTIAFVSIDRQHC